jgi:O-antigen/teichoic acid export membrane protein
MVKTLKLSPFLKDLALTTATSIATGLSLIIVTRLLAQGFGPEGFGAYVLSRRILTIALPCSTLAMGVTVARYIAITEDAGSRFRFLLGGIILGVAPSMGIFFIGIIFLDSLTTIVFHSVGYSSVWIATLFMVVGYSFYTALYAFYRGSGQMWKANLWQLVVMALGPIVIAGISARPSQVAWTLFLMGALAYTTTVPLGIYVSRGVSSYRQNLNIISPLKELFHYGLPRVPGGFALASILATGPLLAPYFGSLQDAGYLIAGQAVFSLTEMMIMAFGLIVLPKAAQLFAEGKVEFLRERVGDILTLAIHLGLFAAIHFVLWTDQIILVWLGHQYLDAIPLMRILFLALIPYLAYIMLRSIIDTVEEQAVNARNLYVALIVAVTSSLVLAKIGLGVLGLAIGTTLGFVALGLSTVRYLWRANWIMAEGFCLKECLWLNIGAFGIALGFKSLIVQSYAPVTVIGMALLMESILFSLYCFMLRKLKIRWVIQLEQRVVGGESNEAVSKLGKD